MEFISNVLLWTPTYVYTGVGKSAKNYIHQLCADNRLAQNADQ